VIEIGVGEPDPAQLGRSITDASAVMNSGAPATVPVSTRTGSVPCSTKALMAIEPRAGMSAVVVITSTPGVAVKQAVMTEPPLGARAAQLRCGGRPRPPL
jgi:hypothetical protein